MPDPVILWFRQDLRLFDQPALVAAAHDGPVIPLYVLDDDAPGDDRMGGASRWWLHHSLESLAASLKEKGSRLILRRGDAVDMIATIAKEAGAARVHAIRHWEPWWRDAEAALAKRLDLVLHDGNHLARPGEIVTGAGKPFRIYTPFWRALTATMPPDKPIPSPRSIDAPSRWPTSDAMKSWSLLPDAPDWAGGFADWQPGEAGADAHLRRFGGNAGDYATTRNLPSEDGTSRLSPHLHFGEVSPRQVWHRIGAAAANKTFLGELGWRDFAANVVLQFPDYARKNAREDYDRMPWRTSKRELAAWQKGRTGYPIVDAGMRQLWHTGWMHNRVRMLTASFLIKHLLLDWREGERWFWDCLVDADYASNSVNWQWTSGSGVDAALFSRIMAPLSQSEKFDAAGYIRQWVPELAKLPDAAIHDPDEAGARPDAYPEKIVGHREARERALAAYRTTRTAAR